MTQELSKLDAVAQAALVAKGEVSALELVDAAIARIEALEPKVHALASHDFEGARARAKTTLSGPFAGVPLLVKDLLGYPGQRFSMGSRLFRENVDTQGSEYTRKLDEAGFVVLGKTTTSELGLLGSTETQLLGVTHNPWHPEISAMGSSGGSAAAVACGMVPMAHASDGGGSIRIPASANGLFGFKPGRGRCVSNGLTMPADMLIEHSISRSVRDSAQLLACMEDPQGSAGPRVGYVEPGSQPRLRIGMYSKTLMGEDPDPEVQDQLHNTAQLCRDLGHEVHQTAGPDVSGPTLSEAFFTLAGASLDGVAQMMQGMLGRAVGEADFEPFTLALIEAYRQAPEGALARALAVCEQVAGTMNAFVERFDVVLCPTIPVVPWPLGTLSPHLDAETLKRRTERLAGYTPVHSIAGVPAMSVPLGQSTSGLPIGSQFAARRGGEGTLLQLAYALEAAAPWADRHPPLWA